jgi:hypothetical protein
MLPATETDGAGEIYSGFCNVRHLAIAETVHQARGTREREKA